MNLWVALEEALVSHLFAKIDLFMLFFDFGRRTTSARAKQQEEIKFSKQMCENS